MADTSFVSLFLLFGVAFGALAGAGAYGISYQEYRQRRLRPGQNARQMALGAATVTFVFFVVASVVLALVLRTAAK